MQFDFTTKEVIRIQNDLQENRHHTVCQGLIRQENFVFISFYFLRIFQSILIFFVKLIGEKFVYIFI